MIKDIEITHSEQVFVSDITYIKTDNGHAYLALVTDAYSKKLMGWALDDNMRATLVKNALKMAIICFDIGNIANKYLFAMSDFNIFNQVRRFVKQVIRVSCNVISFGLFD
jgi:hypothetical protein